MYRLKTISILKGRHRYWHWFQLLWKPDVMLVSFVFDESAKYFNADKVNQTDWNKLCGFSRGLHHKNSIRLCWRWDEINNTILVCEYSYINGKLDIKHVAPVEMHKEYNMIIKIHNGDYPFWGYTLYPYFGGPEKAPHKITLKLRHNP